MNADTCRALFTTRIESGIGSRLNETFTRLTRDNPRKFSSLFSRLDFDSDSHFGPEPRRTPALCDLLDGFSLIRFRAEDFESEGHAEAGDLFAQVHKFLTSDGGWRPHAHTNSTFPEVSNFLAKILAPKPWETAMDPCCGTGELLLQVSRHMERGELRGPKLFGQDINPAATAICRMRMIMHGLDEHIQIECGDSLHAPKFTTMGALMQFDLVVSSPPFAMSNWGREVLEKDRFGRLQWGSPPKGKADFAFISHILSSLRDGGRAAVLTSQGILFRMAAEKVIRKNLLEDNLVEAVITLPPGTLRDTSVAPVVVIFRKNRPRKDVLFADMSSDHENLPPWPESLQEVATMFRIDQVNDRPFARRVRIEEIREKEFNLHPSNYLGHQGHEKDSTESVLRDEIADIETRLTEVRARLDALIRT